MPFLQKCTVPSFFHLSCLHIGQLQNVGSKFFRNRIGVGIEVRIGIFFCCSCCGDTLTLSFVIFPRHSKLIPLLSCLQHSSRAAQLVSISLNQDWGGLALAWVVQEVLQQFLLQSLLRSWRHSKWDSSRCHCRCNCHPWGSALPLLSPQLRWCEHSQSLLPHLVAVCQWPALLGSSLACFLENQQQAQASVHPPRLTHFVACKHPAESGNPTDLRNCLCSNKLKVATRLQKL